MCIPSLFYDCSFKTFFLLYFYYSKLPLEYNYSCLNIDLIRLYIRVSDPGLNKSLCPNIEKQKVIFRIHLKDRIWAFWWVGFESSPSNTGSATLEIWYCAHRSPGNLQPSVQPDTLPLTNPDIRHIIQQIQYITFVFNVHWKTLCQLLNNLYRIAYAISPEWLA